MKRDGACTSLWQHGMPEYRAKTTTLPKQSFDVIIVGGGITGLTTALQLQKAGKKCLLAEAHTIGFGTTGGTTAHLNTFMDTPYYKINENFGKEASGLIAAGSRAAIDLIRTNIKQYSIDCGFEAAPGYIFAQNEQQNKELEDIHESTVKAGVDIGACDFIPVPIPFTKALLIKDQAKFHPAHYIYALAEAFEDEGGILIQGCRVTAHEEKPEGLQVSTSLGTLTAGNIIYATHIPTGINLLQFYCAPYRSYAIAVTLKDGMYPVGLAYDMEDPYHYFRTQEVDGEKYLIAGGEDHKTAHEENTESCFLRLEAYVKTYFNVDEVSFKWSSQYFEPADGLPYIGHLPGNPEHVYVATGFGGNGMIYGTMAATILTDLIVKGDSSYKKLLNPSRIKPVASFGHIAKEGVDVMKKLISKIWPAEKLEELADLAPSEARVVRYEGESIALFKDELHNLHAVSSICPHMKCSVAWNTAEQSWDCPCHGSRFSCDGEILTAPCLHALEKIDIVSSKEN